MTNRSQRPEIRRQNRIAGWLVLLVLLVGVTPSGRGDDFAALCADRAAMERVYHAHRLGAKQSFEQAMPPELIAQLVRQDQRKEAVLGKNYGVSITPAIVAAEVQRIQATTRAPEILAEIQHALGDDAGRFAHSMARPIVVERELRRHFDNDDALHAPQRHEAEQARARLQARQPVENLHDLTWQLTPRPAEDTPPPAATPAATQAKVRSNAYSVEATAQLSQVLAAPDHRTPGQEKFYFEDLDPELQKVLRVQLQKSGDVSVVIETPGGFVVFLAREKTATSLRVSSISIPKRSYEEWLAGQPEDKT